jgi:hypothetical protein
METARRTWINAKEFLRIRVAAAPFWIGAWLLILETVVLSVIAIVCGWRAYQYASETNWQLKGMLGELDQHWRGALILAAALFYRTLHVVLSRMRPVYAAWGELPPSGEPEIVTRPKKATK